MTPDPQLRWIIPSERLHVFLNPPSPLAYLLILLWHVPNHSITRYYPNPFLGWDISQNIFTHNDNEYLYLMSTEYIACPTTSLISGIKVERLILMFTCSPVSTVKKNVTWQIQLISSVRISNSHPDLLVTLNHFSDHTGPQQWTFTFWATTAI